MNSRKPADDSVLYTGLDRSMKSSVTQMEVHFERSRLVNGHPKKGTAGATSKHLTANYPDAAVFLLVTSDRCVTFAKSIRTIRVF